MLASLVLAFLVGAAMIPGTAAGGVADCGRGTAAATDGVIFAVFGSGDLACDFNEDGRVTAADLPAAVLLLAPSPTPTRTPTGPTPTPTITPTVTQAVTMTPTATFTLTATPSPTGTLAACPPASAGLKIDIDDRSSTGGFRVRLTGQLVAPSCLGATGMTTYSAECTDGDIGTCAVLGNLAPGTWLHDIEVLSPAFGQQQFRRSLLVASTPNTLAYNLFARVFIVRNTSNDGNGSLRRALIDAATASKPALIQFDEAAFPAGVPTAILLASALPTVATDDITLDGIDPDGLIGNRIVEPSATAGGIPVLTLTGARNHVVGMRLRNAGSGNRDVISISGASADANLIEQCIVENATSGDGIGIDQNAGKNFGGTVNTVRGCEISGSFDKGVKVTTGAFARIEHSWVHGNANGGIQSTLGGHAQAWHNLVEDNRGRTAQNGLSVAPDDSDNPDAPSELESWGNVSRRNGANGLSVRAASVARVRDTYLALNGSSGIRVFNDVGTPASAVVEGTTAACNGVDGAAIANMSSADFGGGGLGSSGNNGFTQNNVGENFRNATGTPISAENNQWEHCGNGATCEDASILARDVSDHGLFTSIAPTQAQRAPDVPQVTAVIPSRGAQGEVLRVFGSGFNVIDGHFLETRCADVTERNRCAPLRGNCVRIGNVSAPVEAVTPTMLVVRWPFTCVQPVPLTVTTDKGPTGATSEPITVCE